MVYAMEKITAQLQVKSEIFMESWAPIVQAVLELYASKSKGAFLSLILLLISTY